MPRAGGEIDEWNAIVKHQVEAAKETELKERAHEKAHRIIYGYDC